MFVYGIRHHGPGSAFTLVKALEAQRPDIILIEGPPEGDNIIEIAGDKAMKPPVALVVYNPKNMEQASYFPFTVFSPEWQAIQWGLKHEIPIRFIDLPTAIEFNLSEEDPQLRLPTETPTQKSVNEQLQKDPLGYMARLAGYKDHERWWEAMFEQWENPLETFPVITEMMGTIRKEIQEQNPENLRREAYMRKSIRKAQKDNFQNIAIVCGAWHAPALENIKQYPSRSDNAILKGLKKVKVNATWIPWSYEKIAKSSGYGAGVISPAWYELVFQNRNDIAIRWMSKAAQLFRKEKMDVSPSHSVEGARLANTLAAIRNLPVTGLPELREAALAVLCEGEEEKMNIIEERLIIGNKIGKVPPNINLIPIQQDLEKTIRSARLKKEWQSSEPISKELDLRKESNLKASHLLHRLQLINIPWGSPRKGSQYQTGSFKEHWRLKWNPGFSLRIIEAGIWGNTIYDAASKRLFALAQRAETLPELTDFVDAALKADLKESVEYLVIQLEELTARTKDVFHLMDTLPHLIQAIRYGSTRKLDAENLSQLIHHIIPRITVGLVGACTQMDDDSSKEIFEKILVTNHFINIFNHTPYFEQWEESLLKLINHTHLNNRLKGGATRLLFDRKALTLPQTIDFMTYELSSITDADKGAGWLEGFLHDSGLLLIHHTELWKIIDQWITTIPMDTFTDILPILRRTFAGFPEAERKQLMTMAKKKADGKKEKKEGSSHFFDEGRAQVVLPTIRLLLKSP